MNQAQLLALLIWVSPYVGAVLSLLLHRLERLKGYVGTLMLFISAAASTFLLKNAWGATVEFTHPWIPTMNINLHIYVDSLSSTMAFIVSWLSFLIGFYSLKYMEKDRSLTRYWFFFDFFVGSMLLLVLAGNLVVMFLGWEGTGLASYALIGHWYTDEEERCVGDVGRKALGIPMWFTPSHGGLRAIVFTRIGDVGFILGIGTLYMLGIANGFHNPLSIPNIAEHAGKLTLDLQARGLLYLFLTIFSLGAFAKSAQFPFHEWLVTAMTGPTSVSALIHAATMVKAGVYFMLRFVPIICLASEEIKNMSGTFIQPTVISGAVEAIHSYFITVAWIGGFTAFMMATMAIVAREMKLVLAFSTASQLGYMFLGVGAAGLIPEVISGYLATFGHLMSHADFKACLFLGAGAVMHTVESKYMDDCGGLSKYMKLSWIFMLLAALSLSGFPPFMGFWTKDSILDIAYEAHVFIPYLLGTVTAALTAFYSLRWIAMIFFREESENVKHVCEEHELHEAHWIMLLPYGVLAVVAILVGILWPFYGEILFKTMGINVLGMEIPAEFEFKVSLNPLLTSISLFMVVTGLMLSFTMYLKPRYDLAMNRFVEVKPFLLGLRNWLYDRWCINSIYYIIFVKGGGLLSNGLRKWFDSLVVDGFYHTFIPKLTVALSRGASSLFEAKVIDRGYNVELVNGFLRLGGAFRRIQSGKVNQYLLMFFSGLLIVSIILVLTSL